jgi:hypothetical protein
MGLRVVGAGVGRTGTESLKLALEMLLGGRCYHMVEVMARLDDIPVWDAAAAREPVDWHSFLAGYTAAVDWPSSAFWAELSEAFPDAVVLLSTRSDVDTWWTSASQTIFAPRLQAARGEGVQGVVQTRQRGPFPEGWPHSVLAATFAEEWWDEEQAKAAYLRHNAEVRAGVPADRLVEWQPGDGWEPICAALGLPVPAEPFPHSNSTADFQAKMAAMSEAGDVAGRTRIS